MDKRELTSVALIALAAILIANPMYTGKWNSGEPNIEVSAKSVGSVDSTVLRNLSRPLSGSLLHNPNVTDFETLSENETRVVNATLSKGGILIRYVNRSDLGQKYRRIFGNKSFPTYAR
ncbi:MAG: hypothetical protein SV760_00150, partial [Halobacteria archaeon]|nr:hypothetical protein [Halobacteria archaeon]